jgi:hypothetical protein
MAGRAGRRREREQDDSPAVYQGRPDLAPLLAQELLSDRLPGHERLDDTQALSARLDDGNREDGRRPDRGDHEGLARVAFSPARRLEAPAELLVDEGRALVGVGEAADPLEVDAPQREERLLTGQRRRADWSIRGASSEVNGSRPVSWYASRIASAVLESWADVEA